MAVNHARTPNLISKLFRFAVTGVLINGVLLAVYWAMLKIGIQYQIATTISYAMGVTWGYLQNRWWSFQSDAPVRASATKYLLTYLGVYFAHIGLVSVLVEGVGLGPFIAGITSMVCLLVPIFVILDRVVFKSPAHD